MTPIELPTDGHPASLRAAVSGVVGMLAALAVHLLGGGLELTFPLEVYLSLAAAVSGVTLAVRRLERADLAFATTASVGLALLTAFVIDAAPETSVAVWWPLWGLHATTAAYSLTGWPRRITAGAGGLSLLVAVAATSTPAVEVVFHLGSYAVLTQLVTALAEHHAAIAREHDEATRRVAARTRLLSTLARMNSLDTDEVAAEAVQGLADAGYAVGTFGAIDPASGLLHSIAAVGFDEGDDDPVPPESGLAGEAFRVGQTVVIEDYRRWSGRLDDRDEIRGAVGVPVLVDGDPAAVLLGGRPSPGAPTAEQLEVIEILAAQAARVLLNARRFREERRTAERLTELDHLKDDFIASVTHELRTPLTVICGASETLARGEELSLGTRAMLLDRLVRHADRLDGLIGALLYLSQLEAGTVRPDLEGTPADAILTRVVERVTRATPAEVAVDPLPTEVHCDADLICRVLEQLLSNAIVHNPPGTTVRLTATAHADTVEFTVEDHGRGIDPEDARHLRQRFFRGGPSTRRTSSGLGLGLAVADHLLSVHGSELEIRSAPGQGTVASFRLPVAGHAIAPDPRSSAIVEVS